MTTVLLSLAFYLALGAFAGLMAGLLGIGGGLIIVPALAWIAHVQGMNEHIIMHVAIGTSLATIIITSMSSVNAHHRRGAVLWPVFWRLTPGIVLGALAGSVVADALRSDTLRTVFGIFVLLVAAQMAFGAKPAPHRELPGTAAMLGTGGVIGVVSAIVGIGGGSLTVPFLTWCNVTMHRAVGTSAAVGLPIAVSGTVGFIANGWNQADLPSWSLGYVYLPALVSVAATSMLFAPLGARLAHALPTDTLKKVFAGFLTLIGIDMLVG